MKNRTNISKYKRLAPIYDLMMGNKLFRNARMKTFSMLEMQAGQKMLLVGVGTGEDLPYIDTDIEITGIDLSECMLEKAKLKAKCHRIKLMPMNAEILCFADNSFDVVVLSLILSVVENPDQALREAYRVLKPGGRVLVFDKFMNMPGNPNLARKVFNVLTSLMGTDITRRFEDIAQGFDLRVLNKEDSIMRGAYKIILLEKPDTERGDHFN